ncbi:MAG: hypothetical protein J0H98_09915 [Solirubrobacterales bacterium]|nr:hypothetical protein [Solirubrobacterales bacterium]
MLTALGWGAVAASSLLIGALLAFARSWSDRLIGCVLAFGAGALISAVSFSLAEEGLDLGSAHSVGIGLALGALTYFFADRRLQRRSRAAREEDGTALALGSFLDGIPEQAVLGIGIASGGTVSAALLMAIFVSNLPEGIGGAIDMRASGTNRQRIVRLFMGISLACALASGLGYLAADLISSELQAALDGFAAGALLVMLIDSMIPEAKNKAGDVAGLVTVVGFAVATALAGV